ncbi:hypothetical protein [Acinetobacter colistiniresistens]|uniref:hypothetical protein n=1 Tax=Acinetobacter colistiniresistens TaxID=280145 RepID=UPI002FE20235
MKKIVLGTIISVMLTGSTFAACSYDLDASLQDIKSWQTSSNSRFPNYPREVDQEI